jgi:hypothetical protein
MTDFKCGEFRKDLEKNHGNANEIGKKKPKTLKRIDISKKEHRGF